MQIYAFLLKRSNKEAKKFLTGGKSPTPAISSFPIASSELISVWKLQTIRRLQRSAVEELEISELFDEAVCNIPGVLHYVILLPVCTSCGCALNGINRASESDEPDRAL